MMKRFLMPLALLSVLAAIPIIAWSAGKFYQRSGTVILVTDSGQDVSYDSGSVPMLGVGEASRMYGGILQIIVDSSTDTIAGNTDAYTESDSMTIRWYTDLGTTAFLIDSETIGIPGTYYKVFPVMDTSAFDTLFKENLYWQWILADSLSDSVNFGRSIHYKYDARVITKE